MKSAAYADGQAAAAEEIAERHPFLYGGASFGGGPPVDSETGLPMIWDRDRAPDQHRDEFIRGHNHYIRGHLEEIRRREKESTPAPEIAPRP